MSDRLSGIAVFVQAAEAGSFAQAAERLNLSRSAIGKSIARLEQRLDVRLFHRTTRSQSLTDDGQAFYERCLKALAELEAAEAALDSGRHEPTGRLRVSMPVVFGRHCVAPSLVRLVSRYPHIELDIAFSDRQVDLIEDGFDLAVRGGFVADRVGLMMRRLGAQHMVICGSPAYLAARGHPRGIEDLAGHEGVTYCNAGSASRPWRCPTTDGRIIEIPIKSRIRLNDVEALVDAAVSGAGLAWLPCWLIAERLRRGELVQVLGDLPSLAYEMFAVWPQTPHLPSRVRVAIDALATDLPPLLSTVARAA